LKARAGGLFGVIVALAMAAVSCHDALAPTPDLIATLAQDDAWPDTLSLAEIATVSARVTDSRASPISGVDVDWATSDSSIVTIARSAAPGSLTDDERLRAGLTAIIVTHAEGSADLIARLDRPGFKATELRVRVVVTAGAWKPKLTVSVVDTAHVGLTRADAALFAGATVVWQTSDQSVLGVGAGTSDAFSVELTPRTRGSVLVTATVTGDRIGKASFQLPVNVAAMQVSQASAWDTLLTVGDSRKLSVIVRDAAGKIVPGVRRQWRSTNTLAFTVNDSGTVTAIGAGSSDLVATVGTAPFETSELHGVIQVRGLNVAASNWPETMTVSESRQVAVAVTDAFNNARPNSTVHWSSTNTSVFRVDQAGTVTAVAEGSAQLVASVGDGQFQVAEHRATLTVLALGVSTGGTVWPDSITVADTTKFTLAVGAVGGVTPAVHWSSTNPGVFTVDATGTIIAVSTGFAQLVASVGEQGFQTSEKRQTIKVVPLRLMPLPLWPAAINLGNDTALRVVVRDGFGHDRPGVRVTWRSSNENIFTIDAVGHITTARTGTSEVTATAGQTPFQTTDYTAVVRVNVRWASVSAGLWHTCAIATDRVGYCWGDNKYGELGTGDDIQTSAFLPRAITGGFRFEEIAAGGTEMYQGLNLALHVTQEGHTCGRSAGRVLCWGSVQSGQVSDAQTNRCINAIPGSPDPACTRTTPIMIYDGVSHSGALATRVLAGGSFSCLAFYQPVAGDVEIGCWGGLNIANHLPIARINTAGIVAGGGHACRPDNSLDNVECFGDNDFGQAGDQANGAGWRVRDVSGNPVDFPFLARTVNNGPPANRALVSAGARHTCVLQSSGLDALCWGANGQFQLGTTFTEGCAGGLCSTRARSVSFPEQVTGLYAGGNHTCALTVTGRALCWGDNTAGELGRGIVGGQFSVPDYVPTTLRFTSLAAGTAHTCGITTDGSLYCWGRNEKSQLGNGSPGAPIAVPTRVLEPGS